MRRRGCILKIFLRIRTLDGGSETCKLHFRHGNGAQPDRRHPAGFSVSAARSGVFLRPLFARPFAGKTTAGYSGARGRPGKVGQRDGARTAITRAAGPDDLVPAARACDLRESDRTRFHAATRAVAFPLTVASPSNLRFRPAKICAPAGKCASFAFSDIFDYEIRSMIVAVPCPTPMHMVQSA